MRSIRTALAVAALSAAAGAVAHAAPMTALDCGHARADVRNGNQLFVAGNGPPCLFRAFSRRCRVATFAVTLHGVDTMASVRFTVGPATPCSIAVTGSTRVIGPNRTTTWRERCSHLVRRAEGVAVTGCTGRTGDFLLSPPGAPDVPPSRF